MLPADRREREVGWPRAVQTGLSVLGATAFGAIALMHGAGAGGVVVLGDGDRGTSPDDTATWAAPVTPTTSAVAFAATGDSLRVVTSAFSGSGGDTHDSTAFQVDTAGGNFTSPQYFNDTLGAVLTDTVPAIDSGAVVKVRVAHKGANGGWSAWSDTTIVSMIGPGGAFGANEPSGLTQHMSWDGCGYFPFTSDGSTSQSGNLVGVSPTITIDDWGNGAVQGPTGIGLDSLTESGMRSTPCNHVQTYADGMSSGVGPSTYQTTYGSNRTVVYASAVFKYDAGFEHNSVEKMLYFYPSSGSYFFGKTGTYFGMEQIDGDIASNQAGKVSVASLDGTWFEVEVCLDAGTGVAKWWINGTLNGHHTGLSFTGSNRMQVSATYGGGTPSTKTGDEDRRIDHWYISYGASGTC